MKAGDISLTWSLAKALAPYNVTVNCICPGLVYTPLWDRGMVIYGALLREAKAQGKALPPGFLADDLDRLSAKELWVKYYVMPYTHSAENRARKIWGARRFFWFQKTPRTLPARLSTWMATGHALNRGRRKNNGRSYKNESGGTSVKACVATGEPRTVVCKEVPTPQPAPGMLLLKTRYACICGSDLEYLDGAFDLIGKGVEHVGAVIGHRAVLNWAYRREPGNCLPKFMVFVRPIFEAFVRDPYRAMNLLRKWCRLPGRCRLVRRRPRSSGLHHTGSASAGGPAGRI